MNIRFQLICINDAYSLVYSTYCYSTERILIDVKFDTNTLTLRCHWGPSLEEAFYKAALNSNMFFSAH